MENLLNDKNKNNCFEVLLSGNTISNNGEDFNAAQLKQEVLKNRMDGLLENKCLSRIFKTLIFFVMMGLISLGRIYGIPNNPVECLNDPLHNGLSYFNDLVNKNGVVAGFFQISSSFFMDIIFFTIYLYWVLYLKSCRLILTCLLFYSLRAFCQFLVQMRFPPGYYWDDPGFPSVVVPYGISTDFFYSGHVGFLNIAALEWYKNKMYGMSYLTIFIIFYMIFVLLIFRGHYSIDIITGLIASHWIFTHIDIHQEFLNNLFLKAYKKVLNMYINQKYA